MDDGGLDPVVEEKEMVNEEDEDERVKKPKMMSKKQIKKKQKEEKGDVKQGKDYELFLRDLEDDPELR